MTSDETDRKYLSTRGIMKSCNVHSLNPLSSIHILYGIDLSKITDGCTLYITGSAIPDFVTKLETLSCRVILVSGDCDESIPYDVFSIDEFKKFINSDKIIHWFSQNCAVNHPKVTGIPIGLNYHTRIEESTHLGKQMSAEEQENELLNIIKDVKPFYERIVMCYSNFNIKDEAYRKYDWDRQDALDNIPADLIFKEQKRIPHKETFINQSKYAFVASPHGNGLDCHRTWEALVLGCIPIVRSSAIDYLFDDLPALIVQDWKDITKELLENTIHEYKNKTFNYDKLTFKYWMDKINSGSRM